MAYKRRLRFDKRIRFRKSMSIMYILLFVVLASLGAGYAYIKSDLKINGTANVTAASWDVHFENLQVTTGSVTASTPANIADDTTVEFAATLEEPNDFYEFTVDVVNDGTMDAMIDNFSISPTLTTAQKKYLEYTVTYADGVALANKQELKQGTSETIKVRFSYIENSDKTNYPTEDQNFTISFSVDYVQVDSTVIPTRVYLYRSDDSSYIDLQTSVSLLENVYPTYQEVVSATGHNFFLRHRIDNDMVWKSDVGFIYNNNVYYLIGGGATWHFEEGYFEQNSIYYNQNKAMMQSVFGTSNCLEETSYDNTVYYYCSNSGVFAKADKKGHVNAYDGEWICIVYPNESSECHMAD